MMDMQDRTIKVEPRDRNARDELRAFGGEARLCVRESPGELNPQRAFRKSPRLAPNGEKVCTQGRDPKYVDGAGVVLVLHHVKNLSRGMVRCD